MRVSSIPSKEANEQAAYAVSSGSPPNSGLGPTSATSLGSVGLGPARAAGMLWWPYAQGMDKKNDRVWLGMLIMLGVRICCELVGNAFLP